MRTLRSRTVLALLSASALLLPATAGALDVTMEVTECNNDLDDDGDGLVDLDDPGCRNRFATSMEAPECDDSVDNDGDLTADWAGAGVLGPDPDCQTSWWDDEGISRQETGHPPDGHGGLVCGDILGGGPALVLIPLFRLRRRRSKA